MELVDGPTLRAWLQQPPDRAAILGVLAGAGRALLAAHEDGVVHRDFKPENVLIDARGHARVVDFGLASFTSFDPENRSRTGTPGYMAPEQGTGAAADRSFDTFSFCVTVVEALTNTRPRGPTLPSGAWCSPRLRRRLRRGLSAQPNERPPLLEVVEAIEAEQRPAHRRKVLTVAAIGISGVLAAATGRMQLRSAATPPPNEFVMPPNARAFGLSYAQWSTRWWRWAFSLPSTDHPLRETAGDCAAGNEGRVWFLGGVLASIDDVVIFERECHVPRDTFLFVSVINVICSSLAGDGDTPEALQACAKADQDAAQLVEVTLDGQAILGLENYRVASQPSVFDLDLPSDNLFAVTYPHAPTIAAGHYPQVAAAEGTYLMLRPLAPGTHVLHLRGVIAPGDQLPFGGFENDVRYRIVVQ